MERTLIVSATEKSHTMLTQFLTSCGVQTQFCYAASGAEARRALVNGMFDLVLVNTPLPDEFGHEMAQTAAHQTRDCRVHYPGGHAGITRILCDTDQNCVRPYDKIFPLFFKSVEKFPPEYGILNGV